MTIWKEKENRKPEEGKRKNSFFLKKVEEVLEKEGV